MKNFNYLIVGGGMTAIAAVEGIRIHDQLGTIGILSDEKYPPYKKPPLSKGLWLGKPFEKIWFNLERHNVDLRLNNKVVDLDTLARTATAQDGEIYSYERLLLATGGTPRKFSGVMEDPRIIYYRSLKDYEQLRELAASSELIGVIGGGFIGSEIAAVLTRNGKDVVMIFPEKGIGANIFPEDLSLFLTDEYKSRGVKVFTESTVSIIEPRGNKIFVKTNSNESFFFDAVVAGIGIKPNVELASRANLSVDNGILVDDRLRSSQPEIFAAGDVANIYYPKLGKYLRVEHEDNALSSGKIAGENMTGQDIQYNHLSGFYSDMFEFGYEAVGELSSLSLTSSTWEPAYKEGLVFYHDENFIKGILLWNIWGKMDAAREMIGKPISQLSYFGKELTT